ncbi:hypothetical protein EN41_14490 [Agrobacterium tumefaciens]|uniref:Flagellar export protein FliJ n=1 Tax=Agrobacterium fabrum (strain C58 / ATCC 33970) TaxID=176299 RepID=Q7D163_AGRFC|nr:hypothetical protein [Agrobacterium fabrum]KEY54990.1 hypothetical protein EN41_14490 [Agrobacterium tumefaciens]AAK86394.2 hypothetical protein Atu0583 [Agrobacterium fabrum str. C58]KJX89440.1 hypothetical protein SY94_0474 [Agrobacterium tumefaciens]MCX2877272.1 hypothetical protein [Agrobacterium fabrum]NMV68731.1 hypothetical protein [Agrobacterium fabrum]
MASDKRSEKLKRLVTVQRHMEKMAEVELADTTRVRSEVAQSMESTFEAMSSMEPVHQTFSKHYSDRYSRLVVQDRQLEGVQQFQENKVLKEKTKADRLEDRMHIARDLEDREAGDNAIYDLLEITNVSHTPASSKVGDP